MPQIVPAGGSRIELDYDLHLPEPVQAGQVILCQACRVRIQIVEEDGSLNAAVLPDTGSKEDKSW